LTILFAEGLLEIFEELPDSVKRQAAHSIKLLSIYPDMHPRRRRGLMRGYRYFIAGRYLFYYSAATAEIRLTAIIPAAMRLA
jgi:plasmid stabilization system protein ParE